METQKTKKCPKCGEEILASAKRCKHCQADIRNWFMRHKIITGILILILVGIIGSLGSSDKKETKQAEKKPDVQEVAKTENPAEEKPQEEKAEEEKIYKMKEPVPVGNFIHYAGEIKEEQEIGASFSRKKALGIYKIITIVAMNISNESRYLDSTMFKLIDNKGRIYDYSVDGGIALSSMGDQFDLFLKQVGPSLKASGVVIFDVPKDAEGLKLEVSGGFGSPEKRLIELQ